MVPKVNCLQLYGVELVARLSGVALARIEALTFAAFVIRCNRTWNTNALSITRNGNLPAETREAIICKICVMIHFSEHECN